MNEWEKVNFEDYIKIFNEKIEAVNVPVERYVSTVNLLPNLGGVELAKKLPNQIRFTHFEKDDVLFSNIRTYFKKVWRAQFNGGSSNDVLVFRTTDKKKLDQEFLYYIISNDSFINYTSFTAKGTKMPRGDKEAIRKYSFLLPELDEQLEIAKTLSLLDKKINLLQQQNKTLEDLAQTLFKNWFVDLEYPNENNEPYKSSGGKMIASELGGIPDGWEVKTLTEIANYLNGLACQKSPVLNENDKLPVLKIKELGNGISKNSDWVTSHVEPKYLVESGNLIFSWSGTLMIKFWNGEKCVLNQHLFKVTSAFYPNWFIYQWTNFHLNHFIAVAKSKATTMGHINRTHLEEALCLVPQNKLLEKLTLLMNPTLESLKNNNKEIDTLTQLRDTLLPKIMSGKLKIKNL